MLEIVNKMSNCSEYLNTYDGKDERLQKKNWLVNCGIHNSNLIFLNQATIIVGEG